MTARVKGKHLQIYMLEFYKKRLFIQRFGSLLEDPEENFRWFHIEGNILDLHKSICILLMILVMATLICTHHINHLNKSCHHLQWGKLLFK